MESTLESDTTGDGSEARRGFELEPHSKRRRRQLLDVTAHIIESQGPDAVRMPRVAELAGCTRTLVYRYFPQREDLLAGVISRFWERLNALATADEHARGIGALADPDEDAARRGSRDIRDAVWRVVEEQGIAGLILSRSEFPRSEHMAGRVQEQAKEVERRWFRPLREAGLSDAACALSLDCATTTTYTLMQLYRAGEIERDEVLELGFRSLYSLVRGLREPAPAEGAD